MAESNGRPAALGISAELWEVLACPCEAHGALAADESAGEIVCTVCKRRFAVRDGIPVMLLDGAVNGG